MKNDTLKIDKYFSRDCGDLYNDNNKIIKYTKSNATVKDYDGNVIETIEGAIFPEFWQQNAINTVATKYFKRADVPETGREKDIRQLTKRVSKKIAQWGKEQGYFNEKIGKTLEDEITASTIFQYGAFNSPVWFNLGLDYYGLHQEGKNYTIKNDKVIPTTNFYENPQVSACFIVSPGDSIESMMQVGAIISSRIFKGGSGIGGDWSKVRSTGEPVSGGGKASGAIEFMDVQDSVGRVIKSGGTSRRAATMQTAGIWHPDFKKILMHKYKSEEKARVLIAAGSPSNWESHTIQDLRAQNVNISIRTDDKFWETYEKDGLYDIKRVIDGGIVRREPARKLAEMMAFATHNCGDPGIQYHDTINKWNTCKNSSEIWASNPCSEYMFINNSACNLASINLLRFRKTNGTFDLKSFEKAIDLYITAQDIFVSKASYPTPEVAMNSHLFRPLGLGHANIGAYLMSIGLPYDSDEARNFAAAITANMTAEAYLQSTKLAETLGPFKKFEENKDCMLKVMEMHRKAAKQISAKNGIEELVNSSIKKWDQVIKRGKKYGFRNAQVTLSAPTGTIAYMMGCDTTGCEPTYALKVYKELAGGGEMKIVNETVPLALQTLGYNKENIVKIIKYIDENDTVENCPDLKEKDLPVFDCAVTPEKGIRFIRPRGHLSMLGAMQPHLSGSISKTVNCPNNTTVEEIESMNYEGWKLGLKSLAIYRTGSKAAQPLKQKKKSKLEILVRGQREHLPKIRKGLIQKVKVGGETSLFITSGEYEDGRLGELFLESLERGSEINRLLNLNAVQVSEKLQQGMPIREAIEVFSKAGKSQISGTTDHPFIKEANGMEGFIHRWVSAHYIGDISFVSKNNPELRPLPWELRVYQRIPPLHLLPTIAGEKFYPESPSLEETIERISGMNYWLDEGLDTRKTIEKIKRIRNWDREYTEETMHSEGISGLVCNKGHLMINDGTCWKCPICKTSTGGCGG